MTRGCYIIGDSYGPPHTAATVVTGVLCLFLVLQFFLTSLYTFSIGSWGVCNIHHLRMIISSMTFYVSWNVETYYLLILLQEIFKILFISVIDAVLYRFVYSTNCTFRVICFTSRYRNSITMFTLNASLLHDFFMLNSVFFSLRGNSFVMPTTSLRLLH